MSDPNTPDALPPEPPNLRFLRRLVTTLMVVMIGGLLVIVALIVIRFSSQRPPLAPPLALPERIELPAGVSALAVTAAADWYAVVTDDSRILIFDRESGTLRQTVEIRNAP